MTSTDEIPQIVRQLYGLVHRLEELFPGRRFTPDGHLVGSIGEVLAAAWYGLTLLPASSEGHDAISPSGTRVQVKATQGSSIAMRSVCDHLIVLLIRPDGTAEEIYNGPGGPPWNFAGRMQKNGQRPITLPRLRQLMAAVPPAARLPIVGA